ncbi:MAG TPA: nucleotidyltransferase family protein [Terriglobia bacterium]|nr:nucleotidyltransferase family protein [Terriglobia bacterium]
MPRDLTPEDQLCLLLARGRFSPDVAKRAVDRLESGLLWDVLLERARTHGLIPLLYHRLGALDFRGVPQPVLRKLKDTFGINAIRNILLSEELVRVLTRLGAAGVPVIPLKGVTLAESLYGDPALRTCADLDILVPPIYLAESLHLLQASGYESRLRKPFFVGLLARYGKDCALMREEARSVYPLQVHCGLIWGGPAERGLLAEIWADAAPRSFHAAPAYAMSPEWEFLYLAVHAARHGLFPFKWLVDLDWLSVRGALDWKNVQEKARRLGWESAVQSCFAACSALLETPVPEPFARAAISRATRFGYSAPGPLQIAREALFSIRLLPTLSQRLQFLAIRLFTPTPADGEFIRLPPPLFFLYHFLRPLRLMVAVAGWFVQAGVARLRRVFRRRTS